MEVTETSGEKVLQVKPARPWYIEILQRQGLATLIVVAMMYYGGVVFLPWAQETVKDLISWHKGLFDKLEKNSEIQTRTNETLVKQQENIFRESQKITSEQVPILKRIDEGIIRLGDKLEEVKKQKEPPKPKPAPVAKAP